MYDYMVILWFTSDHPVSRVIRGITHSPYSHVAIGVGGSVYESAAHGVQRHDGADAQAMAQQAIACRVLPVSPEDEREVVAWLNAQLGHRYSVLGFLAAGLARLGFARHAIVISMEGEYICSGLVAVCLQLAGYIPTLEARLQTPASLAAIFDPVRSTDVCSSGNAR